jgi:hypothetical protein
MSNLRMKGGVKFKSLFQMHCKRIRTRFNKEMKGMIFWEKRNMLSSAKRNKHELVRRIRDKIELIFQKLLKFKNIKKLRLLK